MELLQNLSQTKVKKVLKIDSKDVESYVRENYPGIPENAKITVEYTVPGGADWSNTTLDVADYPLTVTIEYES